MSPMLFSDKHLKIFLDWCASTDTKATVEEFIKFMEEVGDHLPPITEEIPKFGEGD